MMDSLSALFAKNRHLLDGTGSTALDEVFRDFFITSMRGILNELGFDPKRRKKRQLNYDDDPPSGYGSYLSNPNAVAPVVVPHAPGVSASTARSSDSPYGTGGENGPDRPPQPPQRAANDNIPRQSAANDNISRPRVSAANANIPPEGRALLDTIAGTESPGYNVLYGGRSLNNYDWSKGHPGVHVPIRTGPNTGKTSSAFGRYQFLQDTWGKQAGKLGLSDISPQSQDLAAWDLAQTTYNSKTRGRDLLKDLQQNRLDLIGPALHGVWTSMPGGIEATTTPKSVTSRYGQALANQTRAPDAPIADNSAPSATQPVPPQPRPQQTAAAATPGQPPSYLAIGDSLAVGVGGHLGNTSYAQGGWNPQRVNGLVDRAIQNGDVQGKHIILSGGASNAGGNSGMVANYYPKMIQSLKDAGASQVTVMGVGPYSHYDKYGYNDIINKSAQSGGANFTGPLAKIAPFSGNTVQQGVHPNDYRPIVGYVQKNFASPQPTPSVASSTPTSTSAPTQTASSQPTPAPTPTPEPTLAQPTPPKPMTTAQADIDRPTQIESLRRPMMQLLRPYK